MLKNPRDFIVKKLHFIDRQATSNKIYKMITTFILIDSTWIFFRASNITQAFQMIKSITTKFNPWILFDGSLYSLGLDNKDFTVMMIAIIILIIADFIKWKGHSIREWVYKQEIW